MSEPLPLAVPAATALPSTPVPVAPPAPPTPCYEPWLECARVLSELTGRFCTWLASVLPGLLTCICQGLGKCCTEGGAIAQSALELAMRKRVWVPMAICGAAGISVYAVHAVWYHNLLHNIGRCAIIVMILYLYPPAAVADTFKGPRHRALLVRRAPHDLVRTTPHLFIGPFPPQIPFTSHLSRANRYACLFNMSDMMIFAGFTHLVVATLCSDLPPTVPRWMWWLFAFVLLVDGLDTGLSDAGRVGSDKGWQMCSPAWPS